MESQRQFRRLRRFLLVRLGFLPLGLALLAICRASSPDPDGESAFRFLLALLGTYGVLVFAALTIPAPWRQRRSFVLGQMAIDLAFLMAMIWLTGGVGSVFCPILIAAVFNATTVVPGREPLAFAAMGTILLAAAMVAVQVSPALASSWPSARSTNYIFGGTAHLLALGLALHVVVLLGARLSRGLHSALTVQEEIIENMAEGLVAVDGDLQVLQLNGEARRIFGLHPEAVFTGRPLVQVFGEERLLTVREALQRPERRRFEFVQSLPGGGTVPVDAKVSTILGEGGRTRCRIGLFADMSLRRGIEQAEIRIQKLEELYDLAMAIAHEIRNPLASIRGCAQEVGRARERDSKERRLVEIICRESDRLDRIIEGFMSNARRGPATLRPIDLYPIIEETVVQLRNHPGLGARRIVLESSPGPSPVTGDRERLKQVFLNLGTNAIEATDSSRGELKFAVRFKESHPANRRRAGERCPVDGVEVEVSDNGVGMKPEEQEMAFRPFYTTKESGHGLGLAIVHRIVRDHLGSVEVESRPGEGTRFRVWFPIIRRETPAEVLGREFGREVVHAE